MPRPASPVQEWLYFLLVAYAIMGSALGISIGSVGGVSMLLLACYCLVTAGPGGAVLRRVFWALAFGLAYIAIQISFHDTAVMSDEIRQFITWMAGVVIVQRLTSRPGFLDRFSVAATAIGFMTLPFLALYHGSSRMGLDRSVGLANPNDLGGWFGFCAVYFVVLALETRRGPVRVGALALFLLCLFIVGLTVSRASMIAAALAIVLGLRRILRRGLIPLMGLLLAGIIAAEAGFFDTIFMQYTERGMEESGRLLVWPAAIARFMSSPWIGVGASDVLSDVRGGVPMTPHNSFILIALTAGILPLLLYVGYWIRAGMGAFRGQRHQRSESPFLLPLLLYAFVMACFQNTFFMNPWSIAILAVCLQQNVPIWQRRVTAGPPRAVRPARAVRSG